MDKYFLFCYVHANFNVFGIILVYILYDNVALTMNLFCMTYEPVCTSKRHCLYTRHAGHAAGGAPAQARGHVRTRHSYIIVGRI